MSMHDLEASYPTAFAPAHPGVGSAAVEDAPPPRRAQAEDAAASPIVVRRARVLLAEDDLELRRLVAEVLRKDGYLVEEAATGPDLLDQLWARAESGDVFDVIISDHRMPGFTGLEVLEGLRDECEPSIGDTPILLITAFGDEQIHAEAKRLGARVLDKPFDLAGLRRAVAALAPPTDELDGLYRDDGGGD